MALLSGTSFTALLYLIWNPNHKISNSSQFRDLGKLLNAEKKRVWGNNLNSELSVVKSALGVSDSCGNIKPGLLPNPEKVSLLTKSLNKSLFNLIHHVQKVTSELSAL